MVPDETPKPGGKSSKSSKPGAAPELPVQDTGGGTCAVCMRRPHMLGDVAWKPGDKFGAVDLPEGISLHTFCRAVLDGIAGPVS